MKILIGTPVHISKDYSMERWLENVSKLEYKADLLMADNSPTDKYAEKIKGYCRKYGIKNYKIKHIKFAQDLNADTRIEASQETIRQYVLAHDYDAWFSWECDQIIPADALSRLIDIRNSGNYEMIVANSWARWDPAILNTNMGCTLISRQCLEKFRFLPTKKGRISLNPSDAYNIHNPSIIKNRILKSGGNYIEVFGAIKPIFHLDK